MARRTLLVKKPKYVHELPLNEWVSGELLEIAPGEPGKHSAKYRLKLSDERIEQIYGCSEIDNAVNETHIGEVLHFMYKGKEQMSWGFKYKVDMEIGQEDLDVEAIAAEALGN
jgi:hypothetical protein